MKRGRLLVSVGCVIQLPLRIVCTVSTPEVAGAKHAIQRLKTEMFASDIHLAWVTSMRQGVSFYRLNEWLRHAGWMLERTGDLDLIGIDRISIFDTAGEVAIYCRENCLTHAIVDSAEWMDGLVSVPNQYLLMSSSTDGLATLTWKDLEGRLLNE